MRQIWLFTAMDNSHDAESAQQLLHQHSHSQQSHTMIVEQELEAEQQEKLHVLYDNASTATLNSVQNFSSAAYGNKVGVSSAGDATFEREWIPIFTVVSLYPIVQM